MKIIDILNKINNGKEVPKKVKFDGDIFTYNAERKEYEHDVGKYVKETLLFRAMDTHFIKELLNTEIELIEKNKEIEELKTEYSTTCVEAEIIDKLNELARGVNKLIKEREEK